MNRVILKRAVEEFGSPLYLYDLELFQNNIDILKENLFFDSGLFFSMKANPLPEFCKIANQKKCGVEVASGGELQLAFDAGIAPEHIVFTGPGKTYQELWAAIESGIYMINVESVKEMETIHKLAEGTGQVVSVALRINPCIQMPIGKIQMGGTASQFGMEETELNEELFEKISNMTNIRLEGIHIYMATSILDEPSPVA